MSPQRGFTLIELAIVLVIMTVLIGGLAVPLSAQIQARRIAETNKTLEEAREAIIGYALGATTSNTCECRYFPDGNGDVDLTNCAPTVSCPKLIEPFPTSDTRLQLIIPPRAFLPCPDKLDDDDPDTTDDGDGEEDRDASGACTAPGGYGYLPWVTLGTGNQDAWGNRLGYAVSNDFSHSAGFPSTSNGDIQICKTSANAGSEDCGALVTGKVPVVLVSHGPNGWGARNVNDTDLADPSSTDEKENANTDHLDKEFVSRTPSDDFDDLVKWISADQLRGRICPPGGCP